VHALIGEQPLVARDPGRQEEGDESGRVEARQLLPEQVDVGGVHVAPVALGRVEDPEPDVQ